MAMASLPPNISTRPITWMTTLYIALCLSLGVGQGPGQGSAATPPRGIHNSETVLGDPVRKDLAMRGNAYDLPHPRPFLLDSTNTTSHSHTNRVISSMLPSFRPGSGAYGLPYALPQVAAASSSQDSSRTSIQLDEFAQSDRFDTYNLTTTTSLIRGRQQLQAAGPGEDGTRTARMGGDGSHRVPFSDVHHSANCKAPSASDSNQ